MYFPSTYNEHNQSLKRFINTFNEYSQQRGGRFTIKMKEEDFHSDGFIIDSKTKKEIVFDWEKRHSYYITYGFPFDTFGQFERKIKKSGIDMSIQCSKNENAFCIA